MSEHVYIGACIYICVYMYIKDYISTSWDLELELGCHANLAGIYVISGVWIPILISE